MAIIVTVNHLAAHWKVDTKTVEDAARRGDIAGAHKALGRFVFDLEKALASYTPPITRLRSDPLALQKITRYVEGEPGEPEEARDAAKSPHAKPKAIAIAHRPHKRVKAQYLRQLTTLVSPEEWESICIKAISDAKDGDRYARQWLSNYLVGKPVERIISKVSIETDALGVDERASRVAALLDVVKSRVEDQSQKIRDDAIDIESSPVTEPVDDRGKSPTGQPVVETDVVDSASREQTSDSSIH